MAGGSVREARTTGTLSLPESHWKQFHDVRRPHWPEEKIDQVVVGPSGVHVIEYPPQGAGTFGVDEPSVRYAASLRADAVRNLLPDRYRARVLPVMCFREEKAVAESVDGVLVTSSLALEQIIRASPLLLSTSEVAEVFGCLQARLEPVPAAPVDSRNRRALRRNLATVAAGIAAAAVGVVAFGGEVAAVVRIW